MTAKIMEWRLENEGKKETTDLLEKFIYSCKRQMSDIKIAIDFRANKESQSELPLRIVFVRFYALLKRTLHTSVEYNHNNNEMNSQITLGCIIQIASRNSICRRRMNHLDALNRTRCRFVTLLSKTAEDYGINICKENF